MNHSVHSCMPYTSDRTYLASPSPSSASRFISAMWFDPVRESVKTKIVSLPANWMAIALGRMSYSSTPESPCRFLYRVIIRVSVLLSVAIKRRVTDAHNQEPDNYSNNWMPARPNAVSDRSCYCQFEDQCNHYQLPISNPSTTKPINTMIAKNTMPAHPREGLALTACWASSVPPRSMENNHQPPSRHTTMRISHCMSVALRACAVLDA